MISVRCGAGLGDAIYLAAVARHLVHKGHQVEVCSDYPDVFRSVAAGGRVRVSPFRRKPVDLLAHYAARRGIADTTQFEDCCIQAGIEGKADLRLDWRIEDETLIKPLRARGLPIVLVQQLRAPFGRTDGYGMEMLPDCRVIQRVIDRCRGRALLVQIGAGKRISGLSGIDVDLSNRTTVPQLLDLARAAAGIIAFPSFAIPLAEALRIPAALIVWSRRGLRSPKLVIRQMTPAKLLHRRSPCRWVYDDASAADLTEAADAFLATVGSPVLV